jgi:hypothetical protein
LPALAPYDDKLFVGEFIRRHYNPCLGITVEPRIHTALIFINIKLARKFSVFNRPYSPTLCKQIVNKPWDPVYDYRYGRFYDTGAMLTETFSDLIADCPDIYNTYFHVNQGSEVNHPIPEVADYHKMIVALFNQGYTTDKLNAFLRNQSRLNREFYSEHAVQY